MQKVELWQAPSLIHATPTLIASNQDEVCSTSVSGAGDVMMTSSSKNKGIHVDYSTSTNKDTPEGKIMAVILALMRGKPKDDGYHHCHINKHHK